MSVNSNYSEIRCPVGSKTLLMKMRKDPSSNLGVSTDNLLMLMCRECTKRDRREMERAGLSTSFRTIHCFDFLGDYVESIREPT